MIELVRIIEGTNIKVYQCNTTDDTSSYDFDCDATSTLVVKDETTDTISAIKYFDGSGFYSY